MDTSRHRDYFNPHNVKMPVTIIGAGATGSRVFEALVNLGLTDITVYDDDVIEEHNLANQLYNYVDVGSLKLTGLAEWYERKTSNRHISANYRDQKVQGNMRNDLKGIVFLLTDTIESRKEIYANSLRFNRDVDVVIETRMALVHGNIRMFDPKDTRQSMEWLEDLPDDDGETVVEGETSACGTALTVGTTASIIANLAVNMYIHHIRGDRPDTKVDVYLEPLMISTSNWKHGKEEQAA